MRAELFALSDATHIPASEQAFNMFTVLKNRFMWTLMLCHKTFQSRRQILANITHLPCIRRSVESFTYIISFNLPHATSLSLFTFLLWRRKWQPTPVFLPGESQGRGSLVGCRLWGHTESDTTEVT